ncbi:MAG TPA: Gfo/Idh/MocA family oxidoreductase [Thermomicrobiales bacterium]|nr:Gfo/Idh/MocA family oxidoreductase [Thermomicrobiales bacterium]
MSAPVRVGVIGCGSVARKYIPLLQRMNLPRPRVEIALVCDVDPARRSDAKERYAIDAFTTDERELIDNPDIDAIFVLTSMPEHFRLARAALAAGKHVLVEKPMAMTLDEAAELVDLARRSPGYLVCAPHVVLSPTYQAIWQRLQRGDIGRVLSARGFYGWSGPTWGPWFYQPGGGAMFDLGVYNVTTLTGLLGPAKRVMAMSGIAIPERIVDGQPLAVRTDDNAQLLLDFGGASYAVVTTGFTIQKYNVPGIELYGTDGTIQMIGEDWAPKGYELWRNAGGCWETYEDASGWPWADGARHLIDCIEREQRPVITPEHAYHVLEIMNKTMDSGRTGQALPIDSTFEPPRFPNADLLDYGAHLAHDPGRVE